MSNSYYAPSANNKAIPGNTVRSTQFNGNNDLVEQAFDLLPSPDDLITSRQNFVVSSGALPNLYELTLPGITVLKDGMAIAFKAHAANTGPVSVRVNGTFTRTVKNSIREPLLAGDIIVDTIALLRYDNTNGEFQMANAISNVAEEVEKARVYAVNSQTSAVNSQASAVASEVSRQASAASASDANVSRAAAAISAQNAAQSLTDIYARYLGSRTTYFTQRPDGSPLTGGELMFLATAVNAGRGLYYYDFIDTSWKPSSDPQVATLVSALQTIMSQHIGVGGSLSHPNVTSTVTGFMSSADKVKLDGVATNANNYVHPTGDGNSHVPATGTTSADKVLMAGGTPGSFGWQTQQFATISGTLPVSQGGTGGTTQATGRTGLGLGNTATTTLGSAPGNVLPVGTAYNTTTAGVAARFVSTQVPHLASATSPSTQKPSVGVSNGANAAAGAYVAFEREGLFAAYFGLSTNNRLAVGGWSLGGVQYDLITQQNSTVDANGFYKAASPIVKLFRDGACETNHESRGATSRRISEGVYLISGVLGFNSDTEWGGEDGGIELPLDKNKQALIWVDYTVTADGDLLIKTFHRTHPTAPVFARNARSGYVDGQPIDIPAGRFVDLRVQMPDNEPTMSIDEVK